MKLLTKAIHAKLRRNFQARKNAEAVACHSTDFPPVVKFFTPWANATWLFTELEDDGDTLFGLCDLGLGDPELGCASLSEIVSLRGPAGLRVERDWFFKAGLPLSKYNEAARFRRQIVDTDADVERALREMEHANVL